MPTYEYKCCECGKIITETRAVDDRNRPIDCKFCNKGTMDKKPSIVSGQQWKVR